jgi:pimeloyl-ACP methyl ester carboxylesterase
MPNTEINHDGESVSLSYLDEGEGHPVLLVHGFASSKETNWLGTGWVRHLTRNGFRAIAFDLRGHGASEKFYRDEDYSLQLMAADAVGLIDALDLSPPHIVGYSLGARIAASLAIEYRSRISRVVLSGNGYAMVEEPGSWEQVRSALLAPSIGVVSDIRGRTYRAFAERTGSDLAALAACLNCLRQRVDLNGLRKIVSPVLVAVGTKDDVAGSGEKLAEIIPGARFLSIENRDHMSAVGDRTHIAGAIDFLREM